MYPHDKYLYICHLYICSQINRIPFDEKTEIPVLNSM